MPDRDDLTARLRDALANCFPDRGRAKLFAHDAGLNLAQIDDSGAPALVWQRILDEAARQGRVDALLDLAARQAPAAADLASLLAAYRLAPRTPAAPPDHLLIEFPVHLELLAVPSGEFVMGSDAGQDGAIPAYEQPRHTVTLPDFYIGKHPVTNRQYAEFLRRNLRQPEPPRSGWFLRQPPAGRLDHPVVSVGWQDAVAFCAWLSGETGRAFRLPGEAQWEKAARGTDGRRYPWGEDWADGCCNVGTSDTTPAGAYPAGASPYGCEDMLGNVEEWTSTLWGGDLQQSDYPYPYRVDDGREGVAPGPRAYRIHRGGCYASAAAEVRCAARGVTLEAKSESRCRGFRVVLT